MIHRLLPWVAFCAAIALAVMLIHEAKSAPVPPTVQRWQPLIEQHTLLVWGHARWTALHGSVVWQESAGRPNAGSPAGAVGLMQIMPATWRELRGQYPGHSPDRRDPAASLALGMRYLHRMYAMFGDWRRALSAYNCGPGCTARRVRQHGAQWARHIPAETRHYIKVIPERVPVLIRAGWPGRLVCAT